MIKLRVFVSSRTQELHNERTSIKDNLTELDFETFIFELDAGARTEPTEIVYRQEVLDCHIYVGIFREEYSKPTEEEYRLALATNKEILIYVNSYNIRNRDPSLTTFLDELKLKHTMRVFDNSKELEQKVREDITRVLIQAFLAQKEGRVASIPTLNDPTIVKHYIQKITPTNPDVLWEINPVSSEIMSIWKIMGYEIHDCVFDNDRADFEATIAHWSGKENVFVRCVNGEIGASDVLFVGKHIEEHKDNKAFLFTYSRISPTALDLASKNEKIIIQTQIEFYKNILKPEKYFEKLKTDYARNEIEKYYVPLSCYKKTNIEDETTFVKEDLGDLDRYATRWLVDRSQKHLALLGDFGSGKTWFARRFTMYCLEKYLEDPDSNRLPILISLRDYAKSYSIKQLITDLLLNEYNFHLPGGFETFVELNNQGKFLLIFDGFDEMAQKVDFDVVAENFRELAKVATSRSKVLLTCRTTYFRYEIESQSVLGGKEKVTSTLPTTQTGFEIIQLEELTDEQIVQVMAKRIDSEQKAIEYWNRLKSIYDVPSLAHKPVLIPMLIEVMNDIVDNNSIDAATIYHIYTDRWLGQAHSEGRTYLKTKWQSLFFVSALAWYMLKTQELKIHWKQIPVFINNHFNIDLIETDYYANDLRTNTFLKRDESGFFEFSHKSMTEFFVAYKFAIELGVLKQQYRKDIPEEELQQKSIQELAASIGAVLLNSESIQFLKEMVSKREILKELFNRCKEGGTENLGFLLSNLITLLVVLKEPFDAENITHVNMPSADLQDAKLTNCNIDGGNLSQCVMDRGVFTQSSLNNVNLSQSSFIKADFHSITAENANLTNCIGRFANFTESDLSGSNLSNSKFGKTKFVRCTMDQIIANSVDFSDGDLTDSSLIDSMLDGCNFDSCTLTNTSFKNSQLRNCTFNDAELTGIELSNCNLQNSKFYNQNLYRKRFGSINMTNTDMIGCNLSNSRFNKSKLLNCNLTATDLSKCVFEEVDFSDATLEKVDLDSSEIIKSRLNGVRLSGIKCDKITIDNETTAFGAKIDLKTFEGLPKNFQDLIIRDNVEYSNWA